MAVKDSDAVLRARSDVERSRTQMLATLRELQVRTNPRFVARNAWEGAKEKSAHLAEDAVDAVTKRPLLAGVVAAATVLFAAREPIMNLVGPLFDRSDNLEEDGTDAQG